MGSYFEKVATTELKGIIVAVSEKVVLMYEEPSAN